MNGALASRKNVLERALSIAPHTGVIDAALLGLDEAPAVDSAPTVDATLPFKESKDRLVHAWEREYVEKLLASANGNVSLAARNAGIDRVYLHRLLKKHGLSGTG